MHLHTLIIGRALPDGRVEFGEPLEDGSLDGFFACVPVDKHLCRRWRHLLRVVPPGNPRGRRRPRGCCARSRWRRTAVAEAHAAHRRRRRGAAAGRAAGPAAARVRRARRAVARRPPLHAARLARPHMARRGALRLSAKPELYSLNEATSCLSCLTSTD